MGDQLSITTEMNKLSSALLLIACAYAFVTVTSAFDANDFNDDVFDVFTEEEGLVQTPAATLKKELAAAKAAQKAANAKTNKLNKKLQSKMHKASKKAIVKASAKSIGNRIHAAFQGRLVKHFTKLAKKQARKNKYLRRKQRQAKVSATHALSRNHIKMVKEKAATAKFFANQIKAVKKAGKKAAKRTARRLRMAKARMTHIKNKIKFNKKLAKSIMKKWGQLKAKSESKRKAIEATYARRVKALGAQNARNQKKFNMAVAKGQAYFAAKAKNNAMKAAMAAAKRKELTAKKKAQDKLKESRQKEANHKKMVSNEADTKYKRKAAHAAAMEKDAKAAKAAAAAQAA